MYCSASHLLSHATALVREMQEDSFDLVAVLIPDSIYKGHHHDHEMPKLYFGYLDWTYKAFPRLEAGTQLSIRMPGTFPACPS